MILDSTLAHGPILPDDVAITDLLDQHDAEVSFEVSHNFTEIMIMLGENQMLSDQIKYGEIYQTCIHTVVHVTWLHQNVPLGVRVYYTRATNVKHQSCSTAPIEYKFEQIHVIDEICVEMSSMVGREMAIVDTSGLDTIPNGAATIQGNGNLWTFGGDLDSIGDTENDLKPFSDLHLKHIRCVGIYVDHTGIYHGKLCDVLDLLTSSSYTPSGFVSVLHADLDIRLNHFVFSNVSRHKDGVCIRDLCCSFGNFTSIWSKFSQLGCIKVGHDKYANYSDNISTVTAATLRYVFGKMDIDMKCQTREIVLFTDFGKLVYYSEQPMLGMNFSQQCDLNSIVTIYNEIDSTVGPEIEIADEIADTVEPNLETMVYSENGPGVGPNDFLWLHMQSLSLALSTNVGSINASVSTVIGVYKVQVWDITGCVSRSQLKQAMKSMTAAPFVGRLRCSMIVGQFISGIFIGLVLHDQMSSGGLRTQDIYGDPDGNHSGDLCDFSDQMPNNIGTEIGPAIGTAIRQCVYHAFEIRSDEEGLGNGPAAYSAVHPLILERGPDIGLEYVEYVARVSSDFDDLSTYVSLDVILTRDLFLLGGIIISQFGGQLTHVAPYVLSANGVTMNPDDDKFRLHVISATNDLEVGPIPTQPHAKNEVSYIMDNAGLMRIYKTRTSCVLYWYYSIKFEKCFDNKHIVDIYTYQLKMSDGMKFFKSNLALST
jgi:hypothetical protein